MEGDGWNGQANGNKKVGGFFLRCWRVAINERANQKPSPKPCWKQKKTDTRLSDQAQPTNRTNDRKSQKPTALIANGWREFISTTACAATSAQDSLQHQQPDAFEIQPGPLCVGGSKDSLGSLGFVFVGTFGHICRPFRRGSPRGLLLGWLLSPDVFRSHSASGARQNICLINLLVKLKGIFNLSERWQDVRKNWTILHWLKKPPSVY